MTAAQLLIVIVPVLGAGGLLGFLKLRGENANLFGQSAQLITQAATELVEPLRVENANLRDRITAMEVTLAGEVGARRCCEQQIATLERRVTTLTEEMP